jgi:stalled ribosome rescue protein Dom34
MSHVHAVVWLDHREARVIDFSVDDVHKTLVRHHGGHRQIHHRAGVVGAGHSPEDVKFFHEVIDAVGDALEVLVTGPGQAKVAFRQHVDAHDKAFAKRVVGVESLDHPSDGELLNFARKYFHKVDQMIGGAGAMPGQ